MKTYLNLEYFYYKIHAFFTRGSEFAVISKSDVLTVLFWLKVFACVFSILFAIGIIYNFIKWLRIRRKHLVEFAKVVVETLPEERASQWDRIKKHLDSDNPSDWRMAILEADNLLDGIIEKIGYKGSGLGERLIKIKLAQFKNLNQVWTAHKIRNRIVHEGPKFELTKDDVEKVLEMYKKALEELEYI